MLFARAEALHAHGHVKEACELTRQLAEEMLNNPPDLTTPDAAALQQQQQQQQQSPSSSGGGSKGKDRSRLGALFSANHSYCYSQMVFPIIATNSRLFDYRHNFL